MGTLDHFRLLEDTNIQKMHKECFLKMRKESCFALNTGWSLVAHSEVLKPWSINDPLRRS